jgi:RimJ/RimL family protein N-acetyltransferase
LFFYNLRILLLAPFFNGEPDFVDFFHDRVDPLADTFFIDPSQNNPKARHVYSKAGFIQVGDFTMESGFFTGDVTHLMIKKI